MAAIDRSQVTGLVLAGGRGQRFGGADKGLVELDGRPFAVHVQQRLAPQVQRVIISANRNQDIYRQWADVVGDETADEYAGPLAGLVASLRICSTDWLAVAPCDLPRLPTDAVARLADGLGGGRAAYAATRRGHSLLCLLHKDCAGVLTDLLARQERRVGRMFEALQARAVPFADAEVVNVNSPAELAALETPR